MPAPTDRLDAVLPTDPAELRAHVIKLRSLYRLWADAKGVTPEEGFRRASGFMAQIRAMLGEPTAEEEIEMLRLEREAAEEAKSDAKNH